nr:hypothetical protein [Fredinandcohnia onubensis]
MEISNVIKVQENGLSVIDFELLEQVTSKKFANEVQDRSENQDLFNATICLMDNGYLLVRGLIVPTVYDGDWKRAVNHSNCHPIQFAYVPKTNSKDEFIGCSYLFLHMFEEIGLRVQPLENEELVK